MRLAAALLLVAVPLGASAQVPPAPSKPGAHKPAAAKPAPTHRRPPHKPAAPKPVPPKPVPVAPPPAPEPEAPPADPRKGSNTGLPLPRFAALKSDDVNFRRGPGARYPIEWVYKRRDLPVEIEREFEVWRLVTDPQGTKGWVHNATLTGRRTAVTTGGEKVLRGAASDTAAAVAKLQPGVILRLRACEAQSEWCQVQVGDYRGYIRRADVWGVQPGEVIQ